MSEKVMVYDQLLLSLAVKNFLAEVLGAYESDPNERYSNERLAVFFNVLQRVLEPEEEQLIYSTVHDIIRKENFDERESFLYGLALAKLRGDILGVNTLRTSKRGHDYLPDHKSRLTHVKESLKYKNARATLERIQRLEKGPWIVGGIWL